MATESKSIMELSFFEVFLQAAVQKVLWLNCSMLPLKYGKTWNPWSAVIYNRAQLFLVFVQSRHFQQGTRQDVHSVPPTFFFIVHTFLLRFFFIWENIKMLQTLHTVHHINLHRNHWRQELGLAEMIIPQKIAWQMPPSCHRQLLIS